MAKDEKMILPSGQGGLVRYFDDYKSKIQLKPTHVLILAVAVIIFEILIHTFGGSPAPAPLPLG